MIVIEKWRWQKLFNQPSVKRINMINKNPPHYDSLWLDPFLVPDNNNRHWCYSKKIDQRYKKDILSTAFSRVWVPIAMIQIIRTILQGRRAAKPTVVLLCQFKSRVKNLPRRQLSKQWALLSWSKSGLRLSWQVRPADEEEVAHIFKIRTWTKIFMKSKFGKDNFATLCCKLCFVETGHVLCKLCCFLLIAC